MLVADQRQHVPGAPGQHDAVYVEVVGLAYFPLDISNVAEFIFSPSDAA